LALHFVKQFLLISDMTLLAARKFRHVASLQTVCRCNKELAAGCSNAKTSQNIAM